MHAHRRRSRVFVIWGILASFLAASPAWSQADDIAGRWSLGLRAGLAMPTASLNDFTGEQPASGPMLSIDLSRALTSNLVIGGNLEYQTHKMPTISGPGTGGGKFSESQITVATLMAFMQYRLSTSGSLSPYLLGGLGFNFNWMDDDKPGGSFEVDSTLAIKLGAGADYFLSRSTALNLEVGYKLNSGDVSRWNSNGSFDQTYSFNLPSIYVLAGARFYF